MGRRPGLSAIGSAHEDATWLCVDMQRAVRALREEAARISLDSNPDVLAAELARLAANATQAALMASRLHGARSALAAIEETP